MLLRRSVELARGSADRAGPGRLVAASVGPYGASLADGSEYVGEYGLSAAALAMFHRPRLEALLEADPDLLAIETIPSIVEAEALMTLLEGLPDVHAWFSFSCRDGRLLSDGTPFADAAAIVSSSDRVVATGINCTPPAFIGDLLRSVDVGTPLLAYPNVGSTWDATARSWSLDGPRPDLGELAGTWRDAGATILGGCCGSTPEDVAAIASAMASR